MNALQIRDADNLEDGENIEEVITTFECLRTSTITLLCYPTGVSACKHVFTSMKEQIKEESE